MTDQQHNRLCGNLRSILNTADLDRLVAAYFDPESRYAGATFDFLGDNPPHVLTRDDLLAVSMLDIKWAPRTVRRLLSPEAAGYADELNLIDQHVDLWDADDDESRWDPPDGCGPGSPRA